VHLTTQCACVRLRL